MNLISRLRLLAIPCLLASLLAVSGCGSPRHQGITLVVAFPSTADVSSGSPVEYDGTRVGIVGEVELTDDGELRAELLLDRDAVITHEMVPVAYPKRPNVVMSPIVFTPITDSDLFSIYGDDTSTIDSVYQDGEYIAFGNVLTPPG